MNQIQQLKKAAGESRPAGALKVSDFKCSEHGYINPIPRCPKCEDEIVTSTYLQAKQEGVTKDTSDGYHTFKELYEFRKVYNAALFNEWYEQGKYSVHKSTKHSDGEDCFGGGWFIVVATLPTGNISNHYELKDWDLFDCETRELAKEWDGHTSEDVLQRLQSLKQTKD